jgi:hypothetical protein
VWCGVCFTLWSGVTCVMAALWPPVKGCLQQASDCQWMLLLRWVQSQCRFCVRTGFLVGTAQLCSSSPTQRLLGNLYLYFTRDWHSIALGRWPRCYWYCYMFMSPRLHCRQSQQVGVTVINNNSPSGPPPNPQAQHASNHRPSRAAEVTDATKQEPRAYQQTGSSCAYYQQ